MKYICSAILIFLIFSCSNEVLEDSIERISLQSRAAVNWTIKAPSYLVTDTLYWFNMDAPGSTNYHTFTWTSAPTTAYINGSQLGVYANFYKGGWYNLRLQFYDWAYNIYYLNDALSLSVFEMNPIISGVGKVEQGTTNTYTVDYNNIVTNYTVEWDIPSELSYIASDKQLTLTASASGTYDIKCRVIEQCPLHNESGVHVSNWCSKTITVIDAVRYDDWIVANPEKNSSGTLSFDLRYKSSRDGYHCNAMYYVFLYQGAYDGFYASQAWEWEKALNENYYHPPVIDEEYGFVYCDWDYVNNESYISIGKDELYSKFRTISNFPSNKTIDDIEYVILFVRDNKDNVYPQYSSTCEFEYDN